MTNAAYTRLKPQILHGRRILLTAFVTPNDDYFEPPDGWVDPIEIALYGSRTGCNLATATGDRRYVDSYNRDEIMWNTNSLLQNIQMRQEWGFHAPQTIDLNRLAVLVNSFVKACTAIYRHNHPPVTLGTALIPSQGLQLFDPATGMAVGPLSTSNRIVSQAPLEKGATKLLMNALYHGLQAAPPA
jgi:hypothetical protein